MGRIYTRREQLVSPCVMARRSPSSSSSLPRHITAGATNLNLLPRMISTNHVVTLQNTSAQGRDLRGDQEAGLNGDLRSHM